jgi:hypothetical protein
VPDRSTAVRFAQLFCVRTATSTARLTSASLVSGTGVISASAAGLKPGWPGVRPHPARICHDKILEAFHFIYICYMYLSTSDTIKAFKNSFSREILLYP